MENNKTIAKKIRLLTLKMTNKGNSSHIGSIFSIADILAVLFNDFLNIDCNNPESPIRDRFILSKGHAGAGVYAALAIKGFFPIDELNKHCENGSLLSGHVSHKGINGVEFSTGSLGHGFPVAVGMAYAGKLNNQGHRVVCLLSDGELDEGSNWESALLASHLKLDNLIVIIDKNNLQSIKSTTETLNLEPLKEKFIAFGFYPVEIDGHDVFQIKDALNKKKIGRPLIILANTVKGKGVRFMENNVIWHYKTAKEEDFSNALKELNSI